jgi:hypothetical protein
MADTRDRYRTIEIVFLGLTLAATAYSSYLSSQAINAAKETTAAEAQLALTRESMISYVQGHAAYEATLYDIRNSLPFDIEDQERVNKLTRADLTQLKATVEPIVKALEAYEATFRSTIPAWPDHVRGYLVSAAENGQAIGTCYEQAALSVLSEEEAAQVRTNLNTHCRDLGARNSHFETASNAAYTEMANEVYKAAARLGAHPGVRSPPPTSKY